MNQLARYQVYLEPHIVNQLDELANRKKSSRAKVMREVLRGYVKKLRLIKPKRRNKKTALQELIGAGSRSKTGTIGLNIDEIYRHD